MISHATTKISYPLKIILWQLPIYTKVELLSQNLANPIHARCLRSIKIAWNFSSKFCKTNKTKISWCVRVSIYVSNTNSHTARCEVFWYYIFILGENASPALNKYNQQHLSPRFTNCHFLNCRTMCHVDKRNSPSFKKLYIFVF